MRRGFVFALIALFVITAGAGAQDKVAKQPELLKDQVIVELHQGADKNHAVATLFAANVNPARVLSFPLKWGAGDITVKFDSIGYAGTRVQHFENKPHTLFPDRNAVLLLMLAPFADKTYRDLPPGSGEIARIHFSCAQEFPLAAFQIGPVKLPPENKLMYVTDQFIGIEPAFEFKHAEK